MKNLYLFILLCLTFQVHYSQENYTVNGETLQLTTEIDGELDLLWTVNEGEFRYFVKSSNNTITELKNSKDENKNYLEEYKTILKELTNGKATESLKFRLYDLKAYVDSYNMSNDSSYATAIKKAKVGLRLGLFGGLTNSPFVENPKNSKALLIGGEIEIFEADPSPRHSGFIQGRHTFDAENFDYTTNEIALGYRYRLINKSRFSIYTQVKLATVNFSTSNFEYEDGEKIYRKSTSFDAPFIFGIGSDIKIGKNGYITLTYGELFALFLDNQGNFSTDFSVGYKFNL